MSDTESKLTEILTKFIVTEIADDQSIADLQPDDDLLEGSIVDSLGIMKLVAFIEQEFGYSVPSEDVVIEHFINVDAIVKYLAPKLVENVD